MKTRFNVLKPLTHEGQSLKVGDPVDMTERQAKYLLLQGKLEPAAMAVKKGAK